MIEYLIAQALESWTELLQFIETSFHPVWDTLDILVVAFLIYWLLLLIKGTRAVQILVGISALVALRIVSDLLELITVAWILDNFLVYGVLIIVVLFQADIRRALARVGRGFYPRLSERRESQILEEVVRACQALQRRRVGALIVLERETGLQDLIEAGKPIDGTVSKELLTAIFQTASPLHDGAVLVHEDRISHAGCILPLTLRTDLPEGVGTRHRAAVGITEETDAVVIVVSEETGSISVVFAGDMVHGLDAPELREVLRDYLSRGPGEVEPDADDELEDEELQARESGTRREAADPVGSP